jgi:subtilisin family serine protease
VVGVTAVDSADRVYVRAGRGRHVAFAAPGVAVAVARAEGGYGTESGTSMAAPVAAAMLARALGRPGSSPESVLRAARASAIDLGPPGFDETYGHGRIVPIDTRPVSASGPK